MFEDLIKIRVADVKVAVPAGNGVEAGMVVLEEEEYPHRSLRMFIGQPEARAIHGPWSNAVPPRPSTWDLFVSTIALLDGRIERVVITDVEELRHFFAQLVLIYQGNDDVPLLVTARPSDALALALRAYGAGIYAEPHVLDVAGVLADGTTWVRPVPEEDRSGEDDESGEDERLQGDEGEGGDQDNEEGTEEKDSGAPSIPDTQASPPAVGTVADSDWGAEALASSGWDPASEPEVEPEVEPPVDASPDASIRPIERAPYGHAEPARSRRGGVDPNAAPAPEETTPPPPTSEIANPPVPSGQDQLASRGAPSGEVANLPLAPGLDIPPALTDREVKRKKIKKRKKVVKEKAAKKKAASKKSKAGGTHFAD